MAASQSVLCAAPSISRRLHLKPSRPCALSLSRSHATPARTSLTRTLSLPNLRPCSQLQIPDCKRRRQVVVRASATLSTVSALQWISAIATGILMVARGTTIQKSFLVPLFALQAPPAIIAWIKGEYGMWTAFLTLLIRLFYFIPGELDLPFLTMLFLITAPYQAMTLRGSQGGALIALAIAAYLAFQHLSRLGNLKRAFQQGSIIATLAIIAVTVVPLFFLFSF